MLALLAVLTSMQLWKVLFATCMQLQTLPSLASFLSVFSISMSRRFKYPHFYLLAIWFGLVLLLIFDLLNLNEFYGNGPPYYSRTTNMDKWIDPLPSLIMINGLFILILLAIFFWRRFSSLKVVSMATDIFLKIEGITGESQDSLHVNEIDVMSWSWKVEQSSSMLSGSGGGAPKATVHDLVLTHQIDRSSPALMTSCLMGKHFVQAVITMRKAGGVPLPYFKLTMSDVVITNVEPYITSGLHMETIHLSFAKVKQEYLMQDKTGGSAGVVTGAFDIKNNKQA
ncbi:Hcp family type VI secretion system effector [Methylovorus mays]|uniref:Hcp family type VI secretion system effector n=1 Tax=Methylovorus mays TaxID=184077 RepID=UPI001E497F5D|nr:type VI secretion system tube protein Hcp [Methylovorus mays]MCB5205950.1 type VI secretion system tube protein Hcp [Methylovorus mays]